jgi:LacI family transcriptional regulator
MIIGVLVPNLTNPVFLPFLQAVEHLAQQHGYAVIVADAQRSRQVERRQLDRLSAQRVDALVVAGRPMDPDHVRQLADAGLTVADAEAFSLQAEALAVSLGAAIDEVCDHLAELGHRRLAYVTWGRRRGSTSDTRWHLIETGARSRGIEHERIRLGPLSGSGGSALSARLDDLVHSPGGPTVLWASSHTLAPQLLGSLAGADVSIPQECSFLTFGDSPWAAAYRPAINVVTGDLGSVGAAMTEALLHRLGAVASEPRWEIEPDRYVRRDSVGPAPSS